MQIFKVFHDVFSSYTFLNFFESHYCFVTIHDAHVCKCVASWLLNQRLLVDFTRQDSKLNIGICFCECTSLNLKVHMHCPVCTFYNLHHNNPQLPTPSISNLGTKFMILTFGLQSNVSCVVYFLLKHKIIFFLLYMFIARIQESNKFGV